MSAVRIEAVGTTGLNIALLLPIIIEPYLLNILAFDVPLKDPLLRSTLG